MLGGKRLDASEGPRSAGLGQNHEKTRTRPAEQHIISLGPSEELIPEFIQPQGYFVYR